MGCPKVLVVPNWFSMIQKSVLDNSFRWAFTLRNNQRFEFLGAACQLGSTKLHEVHKENEARLIDIQLKLCTHKNTTEVPTRTFQKNCLGLIFGLKIYHDKTLPLPLP